MRSIERGLEMTEIREYDIESMNQEKKPRKRRLTKSLIVFGCIIGGIVLLALIGNGIKNTMFEQEKDIAANGPYIATLYVEGSIMSGQADTFGLPIGYQHNWTLNKIDEMIADQNNQGLILFVDSPGGGVYESDELYLKLKEYKEKTGRPVYSAMGSMAASGGYYISAAADKIFANRNTWTGSIGVTIGTLYDISGLLDRYGIKTETITAGRNKAMGSSVEPMTAEQKEIFQSLVDDAYDQFTGIVADERKLSLPDVKALADGRVYTAKQALDLGLVDDIGTFKDAVNDMKESYDLSGEVIDVVYQDNSFWRSVLGGVQIPDLKNGDVSALMEVIEKDQHFPISYECELLK
ncbi:MAG: sppA [Bacillota bacterium]|nr:sppA [Bacillota bacterium]